tara:strand:- start:2845 stop:3453 length:609 start_codon:yes stop_codon:yes gene_type:complete
MTTTITDTTISIIDAIYEQKKKRNIWENSKWSHIAELENDDVGKAGERIIAEFCKRGNIPSMIDGVKTKELGGGIGDGVINGKTVEIKTARLGSNNSSFQHELGECPWVADYMIFLDIAPDKMYLSIFKNFTEEFYRMSGCDSSKKCVPYFPTKSICWRKQKGAFKLDTTVAINNNSEFTFTFNTNTSNWDSIVEFIYSNIN